MPFMEARKRGVNVEIIVDPFFDQGARAPLNRMAQAGIALYVWDPPPTPNVSPAVIVDEKKHKSHKPLMHNKFRVFGHKTVWTGSFNFTSEASRNNQGKCRCPARYRDQPEVF